MRCVRSNQGCLDNECQLCKHNPNRKCVGNFNGKYLAGDILKARCGASIWVEVVNTQSGAPATPEQLGDVYLEVSASPDGTLPSALAVTDATIACS